MRRRDGIPLTSTDLPTTPEVRPMTADQITLLDRPTIARELAEIDVRDVVRGALVAHTRQQTLLPAEGYMSWTNPEGAYSRSLAMLGALTGGEPALYGAKIVNAAVSNPDRGIERAGGVALLFDPETARPTVIAEAGMISAVRTAAYTIVSLEEVGPTSPAAVSVLGCGTLARTHLELLDRYVSSVEVVHAYDRDPVRAGALAAWSSERLERVRVLPSASAPDCVRASDVLITTTTSATPYIDETWLERPTFVAHVSLDDVDGSVFHAAEAVYVDDLELVVDNPRRILGHLLAQDASLAAGQRTTVTGSLGEVLTGAAPAIRPGRSHVVSNPFGMAILDVALLGAIRDRARDNGPGVTVDLVKGL